MLPAETKKTTSGQTLRGKEAVPDSPAYNSHPRCHRTPSHACSLQVGPRSLDWECIHHRMCLQEQSGGNLHALGLLQAGGTALTCGSWVHQRGTSSPSFWSGPGMQAARCQEDQRAW